MRKKPTVLKEGPLMNEESLEQTEDMMQIPVKEFQKLQLTKQILELTRKMYFHQMMVLECQEKVTELEKTLEQ
jgi:hypothetical protein